MEFIFKNCLRYLENSFVDLCRLVVVGAVQILKVQGKAQDNK